jgi:hypothetical protein
MFLVDLNERRGRFSDEQIPFSAAQLRKVQNMDLSGNNKVGGLDVETNRDRDRERPTCRDKLF